MSSVDASGLPVNRWASGTDQFHSRLGTKAWNDVAEKLQRQGVMGVAYGTGNLIWTTTTGLVEGAVNFCILDDVGGKVDRAAAMLGQAIMDSGLVAGFVVVCLIGYFIQVYRASGGGADRNQLVQKVLIVALFGIMLAGAAKSTGGGADGSDSAYQPGYGSPGWFVVTIDNVVAASSSQVVSTVVDKTEVMQGAEEGWNGKYAGNDGYLGCAPYVKAMKDIYKEQYGGAGSGYLKASASTPLLLSTMWEKSGLRLWTKAQFGDGNYYGHYMYCRLLEYNADAPVSPETEPIDEWTDFGDPQHAEIDPYDTSAHSLMKRASKNAGKGGDLTVDMGGLDWTYSIDSSFLAFRYSGSNAWRDRAWVGWAACARPGAGGSGNDPGRWLIHNDGGGSDKELAEACKAFFTKSDWSGDAEGGIGDGFDWDDSDDDVSQTETAAAAKDYLLSLHGNKNRAGIVSGLVYLTSSVLVGLVFILFAVAIFVAKIMAFVMMLFVFFPLLVALLPGMSAGKVGEYAKQYFGLSLFAWGAQLLLSVMAFLTTILIEVGGSMVPYGPGGIMDMMWTGLAPVLAAFCMHLMFKKMKIPSPFKPSAGLAWGKLAANGALAGAAGAGGAALGSKLANRAKHAAVNRGKQTASSLVGKERRNQMKPGGTPGGAPPSGVGAGAGTDAHSRAEAAREAQAESKAAAAFARSAEGQKAVEQVQKDRGHGAAAHVRDRLRNAATQFKEKPLRTTAKAAAIAGVGLATGGLAGAALVGGGALIGRTGAGKMLGAIGRNSGSVSGTNADEIAAYRGHQADLQRAHEQAEASEERRVDQAALAQELAKVVAAQTATNAQTTSGSAGKVGPELPTEPKSGQTGGSHPTAPVDRAGATTPSRG